MTRESHKTGHAFTVKLRDELDTRMYAYLARLKAKCGIDLPRVSLIEKALREYLAKREDGDNGGG